MARVYMEAKGRFSQMLATAVEKKGISLRDLAARLDYTYEQMRKIWLGQSTPSKLLIKEMCKVLDINVTEADKAATADRMERKFGKAGFSVMGRNPRLLDIEDLVPQFSDTEWDMFVGQMRGFVHQKRRTQ